MTSLTLNAAVTKAVALETSITDSKLYDSRPGLTSNHSSSSSSVAAIDEHQDSPSVNHESGTRQTKKADRATCKYCRGHRPRGIEFCPPAKIRCKSCSRIGHFASVCQQGRRSLMGDRSNAVGVDEIAREDYAQQLFESAYAVNGSSALEFFTISLHFDGKPCSRLLDTGATRTILTSDIAQPTRLSDRVLRAYNGGVVETLGMTDVVIASGDRSCQCSCFIVPNGSQRVLFGQDVISELELIAQAHIVNTAPVSISVKAGVDPVAQPARWPPFSVRDEIEKELKRLVDADVIESVREASPWVSPIVPVRKHNGSLWLCVDYRQLNKSIVRERHSLPTVEEITAQLEGATVFSVLDAQPTQLGGPRSVQKQCLSSSMPGGDSTR